MIRPIVDKLDNTYKKAGNFQECMYFDEDGNDWGSVATTFVLNNKNETLNSFVAEVMKSKIETE